MLNSLVSNFIYNKKAVLFAINNTCNCRCEMCSIWKNKNKKIIRYEEAKKALIKLRKNNFGYLQITGGEPLLNPDVFKIISFAKKIGFTIFLVTNGTLIDENVAKKISESKVDNVGISFHHYNEKFFERISNHKDILNKVINAVKFLKKENVNTEAMFTISKLNKNEIRETVHLINKLGIGTSFCIPITTTETSYRIGGNSCVDFTNEELSRVILEIISLKNEGYYIINNITFFKEVLNFLNRKSKYYCLGGYKIFYLDWDLNLFPCMFRGKPIEINNVSFNFENEKCNKCLFQCFKEPSLFLLSKPLSIKLILNNFKDYIKFI